MEPSQFHRHLCHLQLLAAELIILICEHLVSHPTHPPLMTSPMGSATSPYMPYHQHMSRQSLSITRTPPLHGPSGFHHHQSHHSEWGSKCFPSSSFTTNTAHVWAASHEQLMESTTFTKGVEVQECLEISVLFPQYSDLNRSPQPRELQAGDAGGMFRRHQHRPSQQWQNLQQQMFAATTTSTTTTTTTTTSAAATSTGNYAFAASSNNRNRGFFQDQDWKICMKTTRRKKRLLTNPSPEDRITPIVVPVPKHGMNRLSINLQKGNSRQR